MPKKGYADVLEKRDPTKQVPVEERIGRTTQKLAESDRRSLQNQIISDEESLEAAKQMPNPPDLSETRQRIVKHKMILQHDDEIKPSSASDKDRLMARQREIEAILKKEMPTRNEMWPKAGSVEAQRALRHNLKFQEDRGALCEEWQNNQRILEPDDPNAQSLELIRPD